jgi:hypothetical protein
MGALDNMLAGKRQERTTTGALDRMIEASKQEQTGTQTAPRSVAAMRKSAEYRPLKTAEEAVRATTEDTSGSGGKADTPTFGGRLKRMASGAGKQYASSYANLAGLGQTGTTKRMRPEAAEELDNLEREIAVQKTLLSDPDASEADRESARSMIEGMEKKADAYRRAYGTGGENEKTAAKLYKTADDLAERGAQDVQEAKRGLGKVGSLAVDAGVGGMQLGADILLGLPTGGAMVPMALRSAGGASQEARQEGASHEQQTGYGMAAGAISVLTEGLSNAAKPLAKVFGKGIADDMVEQAVKSLAARLANTPAGRTAAQVLLKTGVSALGEGFEEMAEDVFDVAAKRMIYDPTAELDVGEMLYDGLVGGTLGGVLGLGGEIVGARGEYEKYRLKTAEELAAQKKAAPTAESGVQTETAPKYLKTVEEMAAEKETAGKSNYNAWEADAIRHEGKTFRNLVAGFDTSVSAFFDKWSGGRKNSQGEKLEKLYLGMLTDAQRKTVGDILGYPVSERNVIVTNDDVRHILREHGSPEAELRKGNLPLERWAIDALPEVVTQPDSITPGEVQVGGKNDGKRGVLLSKSMPDGKVVTVQFDNKGRGTMEITTMYVKENSGDFTQTLNVEKASPQLTAEPESGPVSPAIGNSIPSNGENVKRDARRAEYAQKGPRYLKTAEEMAAERAAAEETGNTASPLDILQPEERRVVNDAADALRRKLMQAMSIPNTAQNRTALREAANRIAEEWANTRSVPQTLVDSIFEKAWVDGVVVDDAFYNEYKPIKDHLRGQKITLNEADRANFADWADFRKSTIGTLRIVNEGGLPVDIAYSELSDMAPELFPRDITHPADQLRRMAEVGSQIHRTEQTLERAFGENAADFYAEKKSEFEAEVDAAVRTWSELVAGAEEREARRKHAEERRRIREEVERRAAEERRTAREQRTDYRPLKTAEQMMAERAAAEEASYRQAEQSAKSDEIGEMLDDLRQRAPQGPEKPSTVRGTGAMDTLDIRIEGDQGDYGRSAALRGAEEAKRQTIRARRKAEEQMSPTAAEKTFAKGVADGTYQENDIPASMNREKVLALADYYYAESTFKGIGGVQERATEIREQNETLAKEVFEKAEKVYRPMNMLKMNLNTPERVMRRSFGETIGEEINSTYFYPTQKNEAEKVRWINRMLDEVRTFKGKDGTESELTQAERAFVQQIMEDRAVGETVASMELRGSIESAAENIRGGAEAKDAAREFGLDRKERELAERLARWRTNEELLASGEWDSVKIENAMEKFSKQYDLFYDAINDFLTAHGFAPIGFIKGYAPHMQKAETQNKLSSALKAMGVNIDVTELPTSISGRTADYKPGKRWVGNFLHRKGSSTDYDISAGYESYVGKIADVFYHTDDIARLRGLERYLRKTYAPEEISNAIDHAQSLRNVDNATKRAALEDAGVVDGGTELSAVKMSEELEKYIGSLYDDVSRITKYGEFVKYIDNYANLLAGKQSMADRGLEYIAGRTSLNAGNKLVSMFARAQVAGNLSSVLNQSSQLKDIAAEIPAKHITKAIGDICRGTGGKPWNVKNTEMFNSYDLLTGKKGIEYLTAKDNKANAFVTGLFKPADIADSLVSALAVQSRYNQLISEGKSEADAKTGADRWATSIMASRMKGSRPMIFESKNVVTQMISMFQVEAANSWAHLTQDLPAKVKSIETQYGKGAAQKYVAVTATKGLLSAFLMNRIAEAAYGGTPASFDLLGYAARFLSSGMGITVNEGLKRIFEDMAETVFGENIFGGDDDDDEDKNQTFDLDAAVSDAAYDISNDIPFVRGVSGALGLGDQTLPLANVAEAVGGVKNALTAEDRSAGQIADAALELGSTLAPGGRQLQKTYQGAKTMLQGGRTYGYGDKKRLQYTVEQTPLKAFQAVAFGNSGLSETRDFYAGDAKGLSVRQTQAVEELHSIGVDRTEAYGIIRKMRGAEKQADKARIVAASDLTDEQMIRLYGSISSEKEAENIAAAYSADISPAVYIGLKTKAGAMEADRDADGEVINGSKREKVLKLIDSMELSDYQKDVLYLTEGYSEKTIDDAPWNQSEYEKYRLKLPKYELPEYELKVKPLPRP